MLILRVRFFENKMTNDEELSDREILGREARRIIIELLGMHFEKFDASKPCVYEYSLNNGIYVFYSLSEERVERFKLKLPSQFFRDTYGVDNVGNVEFDNFE